MKFLHTIFQTFLLIAISTVWSTGILLAQSNIERDTGYIFCGPRKVFNSKQLKKNLTIEAFTQDGMIVTTNKLSPWYNAALFAHGSIVKDTSGHIIKEVLFYECADKKGDISWCVNWKPNGDTGDGSLEMVQGIGQYAGISGNGKIFSETASRADGYHLLPYRILWRINSSDPPFSNDIANKSSYLFMDKSLSFHGPHKVLSSKTYTNGISLVFSTQSGVLMSQMNADITSPRNNATCFDRGNTIKLNGKTLGDIMLLEDTDEDGDVVWLYHIWWYNKGPGIYQFIGGIGKWAGINGVGVTRGMYKKRSDDHYMLKSELYWNLPGKKH